LLDLEFLSSSLALEGVPNPAIRSPLGSRKPAKIRLPFTTRSSPDDIDVFDTILFEGTPVHFEVVSLRPASRDIIR